MRDMHEKFVNKFKAQQHIRFFRRIVKSDTICHHYE